MNKQDNAKTAPGFRRKPLITALESRILLDGAAVATTLDMTTDLAFQQDPVHQPAPDQAVHFSDGSLALAPTQLKAGDPGQNNGRREVAFVDSSVADYQTLVDGIGAGIEVRLLDGSRDGLAQLAVWAQNHRDYDAIHILSHGAEGQLRLGSLTLDGAEADGRAAELATLGQALTADGDLLLYGCSVAGGEGQAFLARLASLTGADVAASDDATGAAALGGDWELEVAQGRIETGGEGISAEAMAAFQHTLAETVIENTEDIWNFTNVGIEIGQSFTATQDGRLTKIGVANDLDNYTPSGTATLKVYSGEGVNEANLLYTKTGIDFSSVDTAITNDNYSFHYIAIDSDVQLTSGQVYTFYFTPATAINLGYTDAGSGRGYDGGVAYVDGSAATVADLAFSVTIETGPANSAPVLGNLDGDSVAWPGAGNTVSLDAGDELTVTDTELDALNGGDGDWSGASLTVQRAGGGLANDILGFDTDGAGFSVVGSELQSGGQTFATFTNSGGVLTVTFTGSNVATTALVQEVMQSLSYRNDTPYGDATLSISLSDGTGSTGAEVTVTSDTIYVDQLTDDGEDDTADGFSLREAVTRAASQDGTQTLVFGSSLAGQTLTLDSSLALAESLILDADGAPGLIITGSGITLASGVSLSIGNGAGDDLTINSDISGDGALVKSGAGTLTLGGTNSYGGGTTVSDGTLAGTTASLQGDITNNATLTIVQSANGSSYTGVISGSGELVKAGAGTLTLSGTNSYSGGTRVTAGQLAITSDANLGSGNLTLDGGWLHNGNATFTLSRDITLGAAGGGVFVVNGDLTVSGVISGSGALTKLGGRTLTLSGINTYSGTTNLSAGTLSVAGDANLGTGSLTLSGGTLAVTANGTIDNAITLGAGGGTLFADHLVTLSGVISGTGSLTKTGGSWLSLYGNNSYSGDTHINSGGVGVYHNNALGATSGRTTVADGAALSLGSNITLAEDLTLAGAPGFTGGGALSLSGSGDATLTGDITLSGDAGIRVAQSGSQLTLSGTISGGHALTTTGNGTLELSGGNSYSGATTVSAGTLLLTGSLDNTSGVTVAAGATLAGGGDGSTTGIINGGLTVNGTLSPGASSGATAILVVNGNLAFGATGSLVADINGTSLGDEYDILSVHGGVTIDSGATLSVTHGYTPGNADSYRLITNDGSDAISGTFTGLAEGGTLTAAGNGTELTAYYGATDGGDTSGGNELMLQAPVNALPEFANLDGGATFVEGGSAVVIDGDVTLSDAELDALEGGNGNYHGASVTLVRAGGANADDQFGNTGLLGALSEGQGFTYDGVTLGVVTTHSGGLLKLTFNGNATSAIVDAILQSLTYANGAEDPSASVTLDWTFNDGSANSAGSNQTVVNITAVNDAPTLTATPADPTFTENGSAVTLFSGASAATVESGQGFGGLVVTVGNLSDGTAERLGVDGSDITLTNGTSGTTSGNGLSYSVAVSDGTATLTFSGGSLSTEDLQDLVEGMTYSNSSEDPGTTSRVVTITSLTDSGGTANGGADTAALALASTVTVVAVNDAPLAVDDSATAIEAGGTANGSAGSNASGNVLSNDSDVDGGDSKTVSAVRTGAESGSGDSGTIGAALIGQYGSLTLNADGSYSYVVDESNAAVQALRVSGQILSESFTYTVTDTDGLSDTATLTIAIDGRNDAPVAVDDGATAIEAGGVANGSAGSDASGNVLSNDLDVDDGDSKTVSAVRTGAESGSGDSGTVGAALAGQYGSLTLNADGTYNYVIDESNAAVQALRVSRWRWMQRQIRAAPPTALSERQALPIPSPIPMGSPTRRR
ncbi:DUF4347 domain-containing protein [Zobellella sp. An-6]|uniref:DUF4347 domain-containing protein n=1 Tax=Zobellella sp. An-6 TaxID=3400218 RepID=UPI0040418CDD